MENKQKIIKAIINYNEALKKNWKNSRSLDEMGFSDNPKANQLLVDSPNAFVFAVIFDQGIPAERAWTAPYLLKQRLGKTLDLEKIVKLGPDKMKEIVCEKRALHRFHYLGIWVFEAAKRILKHYGGDASRIWKGEPSAVEVVRKFEEFVGIGQKKANMATKILHRNLNIPLKDMHLVDIAYDIHLRRVFLRTGLAEKDNAKEMISAARKLYPQNPSDLDSPCWHIGRNFCHSQKPNCLVCVLNNICPKLIHKGQGLKA